VKPEGCRRKLKGSSNPRSSALVTDDRLLIRKILYTLYIQCPWPEAVTNIYTPDQEFPLQGLPNRIYNLRLLFSSAVCYGVAFQAPPVNI
jgi:hypothetical protein